MSFFQNTRLPFSPDQLSSRPVTYAPGACPDIPPLCSAAEQLAPEYPYFVTEIVNAISAEAADNPLRTFLYNQMSSYGWRNAEYREFIDIACVYAVMQLNAGASRQMGAEKYLIELASLLVMCRAANNAKTYVELRNMIPPNMQGEIEKASNAFDDVIVDYQRGMRSMSRHNERSSGWGNESNSRGFRDAPQQSMQRTSTGVGSAWDSRRDTVQTRGGWGAQTQQSYREELPAMRDGLNLPASASARSWVGVPPNEHDSFYDKQVSHAPEQQAYTNRWEQTSNESVAWDPVTSTTDDYYDRIAGIPARGNKPPPPPNVTAYKEPPNKAIGPAGELVPVAHAVKSPSASQVDVTKLVPLDKITFKPSKDYPYLPAYNPNKHVIYIDISNPNVHVPVFAPKDTTNMNLADHIAQPSYTATQLVPTTQSQAKEKDKQLMSDIAKFPELGQTLPTKLTEGKTIENENIRIAQSEEEIWVQNNLRLQSNKTKEQPVCVYRSAALVTTPVITKHPLIPVLEHLTELETLRDVSDCLDVAIRELRSGLSPQIAHTFVEIQALRTLNQRFTDAINTTLREDYAQESKIDSFVDDYDELVRFLAQEKPAIWKLFRENETSIVRRAISFLSGDLADQETDALLDGEEFTEDNKINVDFFITHFYDSVSFTTLALDAAELMVELPTTTTSVLLTASYAPTLHALAKSALQFNDNSFAQPFNRHLLRTQDGVIFSITRTPTQGGQSHFMVSLY